MADKYPAAQPHDDPVEIFPDVLYVHGSFRMAPGMTINRNMVVLRHDGELSLINPVRLSPAGEKALQDYGEITRLIRLGPMHGLDDPYYVDRFGAELWSQEGGTEYADPPPLVVIDESTEAPFPSAKFIPFRETKIPECVLLLERDGGILLSCDSIQHWASTSRCSLLAKAVCYAVGFMHPANIGPFWLKLMTKPGGSLKPDFERILEHDFEHVIGAHGQAMQGGAKAALRATVDRVF